MKSNAKNARQRTAATGGAKWESPRIPQGLTPVEWPAEFQREESVRLGLVSDRLVDSQEADKACFESVIFTNVTFSRNAFSNAEFTDVIFEKCDFSNESFRECNIHRAEFRNCKLMGLDLSDSTLRYVRFHACSGDYANFRYADMRQVRFEDCSLRHADFYSSTMQKVELERSNLDGAQLSGTKLDGIDLSDCDFTVLGVEAEDLRGCIINESQAAVFASLFGLIIKS